MHADSLRKEGGEGPIRSKEDLHYGEVDEAAAAGAKAEASGEGTEESSGVPDICAAHGRSAPEAV